MQIIFVSGSRIDMFLKFSTSEETLTMNVWVPILLLLILAEVWWFGAHCTAYLSDIRDLMRKMAEIDEENPK